MQTTQIEALQRQSQSLQKAFEWAFSISCFLLFSQVSYVPIKAVLFSVGTPDAISAIAHLGEIAARSLPSVALLGAVWTARGLFKAYGSGAVLTPQSGRAVGRLGDWLTASGVLALFVGPASDTMDAVTGAYISTQIALIGVGLAIRLLGQVQAVAAAIKADNEQIV
ncbi:MAG: hypothetical protein B7Y43_07895 [Sphingomonas sp. 28-62-20]|uniref:hypothetical protein n=1 Tax=Sphingomonas sp. 28-62-20 TaxID=1970433 RepID=UPI000BDC704F|nr:MAG: hypothetical protein B7Y43_07895 [Sphingomonas sp. 28-62-20]